MNLNKVLLIGRLTVDPQLRATSGGNQVATFGLATNRVWNDKAGQRQEQTEFHNIVAWGRQAEIISKFLTKGSLIFIEGRMQTRAWEDKEGGKRKTTEIVIENFSLGPKPMSQGAPPAWKPMQVASDTSTAGNSASHQQQDESLPVIDMDESPAGGVGGGEKEDDLPF